MNLESKVQTLYQNSLNPKLFVLVEGLSMNPAGLRSPAVFLVCVYTRQRMH